MLEKGRIVDPGREMAEEPKVQAGVVLGAHEEENGPDGLELPAHHLVDLGRGLDPAAGADEEHHGFGDPIEAHVG